MKTVILSVLLAVGLSAQDKAQPKVVAPVPPPVAAPKAAPAPVQMSAEEKIQAERMRRIFYQSTNDAKDAQSRAQQAGTAFNGMLDKAQKACEASPAPAGQKAAFDGESLSCSFVAVPAEPKK